MEPSPEDVILEEEIDPNYEPTEEELLEYATWLGMDLINHKNLLWIAKEALIAPLPNDWKPCLTEEDEIYYFNFTTGRSIWDHPCDEYYRKVYKGEVEKLNQLQQGNQAISGSSPNPPRDQRSSPTVVESKPESLQKARGGDPQSSYDSLERVSARDPTMDSKSLFMSSFPIDTPSSSKSNNATRSCPPPHLTGHPALSNLSGRSFDSTVRLYAASLAQNGGSMPLGDLFRMQEATRNLQFQRTDIPTPCVSTASDDTSMSRVKRLWIPGDERRAFEKRISQIKDRIEKKLVDEERVVLQQERVEMLERVCKQVQEEESNILDSLRKEIMERMERNIREESQALLAKRRKEIVEEVEREMQAERLVLRENQKNEEKKSLEADTRAIVSKEGMKPKESEVSSSEAKKTNTSKGLIQKQLSLKERGGTASLEQMEQGEATDLNTQRENENVSRSPCLEVLGDSAQDMRRKPIRTASKILLDHDQDDGIRKDSSKKVETGCGEEERFEKSFHVRDLRTSLLLKLEVLMKIGTSND